MPRQPIRYFDRYAKSVKTETVFGERWLRFAYENPAGRFLVWLLVRRAIFSHWYGWRMNTSGRRDGPPLIQLLRIMLGATDSAQRVLPFIEKYNVDVDEFAKSPFEFRTFNEFFYRRLKPEVRPIAPGERVAVMPADGRHLAFPDVDVAGGFYVKGAKFALGELLGEAAVAAKFAGGAMLISRLCPVDYHRFHFPVSGTPGEPRLVNGWLYSVNPVALRRNIRYLVENKRMITLIESPEFGPVAMIEVGATNVGTIRQGFVPGRAVAKGEEKGLFAFGGSCVITLFQRGRIRFDEDLVRPSAEQMEVYAKMGDRLGEAG
ncbi:MAG TPA: archaetidylserine decarboxylase [Opitutus sp.]|nr:archaetidylserine decarboxylase [Opitutus sp.]